ncbi:MAG: hypothetical protein LKJ88_05460 [Bacilli bacterium]|jgi:uncharacterized protein YceK|nr:hypothetical protein [Bacilli bacterium]
MKKLKKRSLISFFLLLLLSSCGEVNSLISSKASSDSSYLVSSQDSISSSSNVSSLYSIDLGGYTVPQNSPLHFTFPLSDRDTYPNPYIGDVHPYFDERTNLWYLYYLDTTGQFNSQLLVSPDGLTWQPRNDFWIYSSLANYGVLNVTKKADTYYSYYADFQCSKSKDLMNWEYAGLECQVPLDTAMFPGGMRDPSVIYDKDDDRWYAIGLVYPKRVASEGIYQSNLAITMSNDGTNTNWNRTFKKVLKNDQFSHDYECPMLQKIGNRWYVFGAHYGFSDHGVGRLSYFIGDENKNPYQVDWTSKEEHFLTSEDLCAPQVMEKNGKHYVFGWIPTNYNNGVWGGLVNLTTQVTQGTDGLLFTKWEEGLFSRVSKENLFTLPGSKALTTSSPISLPINNKRYEMELGFDFTGDELVLETGTKNYKITINQTRDNIRVNVGNYQCFSFDLQKGGIKSTGNILRIIAESKTLELELNSQYVLTARLGTTMAEKDSLNITAQGGNLEMAIINSLAYLDEIK